MSAILSPRPAHPTVPTTMPTTVPTTVLILGARGFIGRHIASTLLARGYRVIHGVRPLEGEASPGADTLAMDLRQDLDPATWIPRLAQVDWVINAVGVLREQQPGDFSAIHELAPAALFAACLNQGVGIIQISALGAGNPRSPFLASKGRGDEALATLLAAPAPNTPRPPAYILRPGLIHGPGGTSASLFQYLATWPWLPLPDGGSSLLQPIHIEDLCGVVLALLAGKRIASAASHAPIIPLVGPRRLTLLNLLRSYRQQQGRAGTLRPLPLPPGCWHAMAALGERLPGLLLNRDTLALLRAGSWGDPEPARQLLGHPLRDPDEFFRDDRHSPASPAGAALPSLAARGSLVALWLGTALASISDPATGFSLLAPFLDGPASPDDAPSLLALCLLYGASAWDALLGIATLLRPGPWLWWVQAMSILVYSGLVLWKWPGFLGHPFGPLLKNLPILALLGYLGATPAPRPRPRSSQG